MTGIHQAAGVLTCGLIACAAGVALLGSEAQATTVVTGEGLPASGLFSSLSREAERAVQQFFPHDFFSAVTEPMLITSMSFRLPAAADVNYPALGDLDFSRYDITLAEPSAAVAMSQGLTSSTFSENMSNPVLVRSGALTIPHGSFVSNGLGEEAEFSFEFTFDTPYSFTPGQDLVMLVRHSGHGDVHGVETRWNFDGYAWENGTILNSGDADAAVANFGPGAFDLANRIQFTFVPGPGAAGLLALGGLAALRRRR